MIQHTVFFKFPSIASIVPPELNVVLESFRTLPGLAVQFFPHGVGIAGTSSKEEFLDLVAWPDKTEGYTHCLLVVAIDEGALKTYLHSDAHLKDWMGAVKPFIEGICVFDNILDHSFIDEVSLLQNSSMLIQHTVFFKFPSIASDVPSDISHVVAKFNDLSGIVAQFHPHGVGISGANSKEEFLDIVSWPDKTADYTHCLLVVADSDLSLKNYLHSDEHLKQWMPTVKPYIQGICVFDNILEPHTMDIVRALFGQSAQGEPRGAEEDGGVCAEVSTTREEIPVSSSVSADKETDPTSAALN